MAGPSQHAIYAFTGEPRWPRVNAQEAAGKSPLVLTSAHAGPFHSLRLERGGAEGSRGCLHACAEEENLGCLENTVFSEQTFEIEQE